MPLVRVSFDVSGDDPDSPIRQAIVEANDRIAEAIVAHYDLPVRGVLQVTPFGVDLLIDQDALRDEPERET
jgi:hypothetical protein